MGSVGGTIGGKGSVFFYFGKLIFNYKKQLIGNQREIFITKFLLPLHQNGTC
jgi:hypothetical protein